MSLVNGDAIAAHNFAIQIDGITVEYVYSIGQIQHQQDVIEYVQNTAQGTPVVRKMPGISKGGTIQVVRGATQETDFATWIKTSLAGDMTSARKNLSVIHQDYQKTEVFRYNLTNAWCSSRTPGDMTAGQASVVTETITIVYEDLVYA